MYTVIVTGGIGSGKSSFVELLRKRGTDYLSLDEVSRYLLTHSEEMKAAIVDAFGKNILDDDGAIIPAQLAYLAFATPDAVALLNEITFPFILQRVAELICEPFCSKMASAPVRVIEVPLLTEAPELADLADEVITITVPLDIRLERLEGRGMDRDDAAARDALQASDQERFALSDTIIDNSGSLEDLEVKANAWWDEREASGWQPVRKRAEQEGQA